MTTRTVDPTGASAARRPPAPPEMERLRRFVNTRDVEQDTERFEEPRALETWLEEEGLPRPERISRGDLTRVREVREALRAIALANNEGGRAPEAEATLDAAARRADLSVRFREGSSHVEPGRDGVDAAIGSLLAIVDAAMRDGSWSRFKVCRNDRCRWAFYDSSRNRGGHWCTMAVCGSRMKARAYRDRNARGRARSSAQRS